MQLTLQILSLLLLSPSSLHAHTNYHEALAAADTLKQAGKLTEAIKHYKKLGEAHPDQTTTAYRLAGAYALNGNHTQALHYLKQATQQSTDGVEQILQGESAGHFINLIDTPEWKQIEDTLLQQNTYKKPTHARQLWRMYIRDQAYYYHLNIAEKQLGNSSPIVKALWAIKEKLQQENQTQLQQILAEDGWPKHSEVGENATRAAFLVARHAAPDWQKAQMNSLKTRCEAGEAHWDEYAFLYDYIAMREGKPQLYGIQIHFHKKLDRYIPWPIEDPQNLNKRRQEKGLSPIEKYWVHWNIDWELYEQANQSHEEYKE